MNKQKVTRVLIIISVIIMVIGIMSGMSLTSELRNSGMPKENIYVDGTNFTDLSKAFVSIGSTVLGIVIGIYFAMAIVSIWIIYGIILLIIKIVNKVKEKQIK